MIKVGIIDYKCGNIRSLFNALEFIQANPFLIKDHKDFDQATHIILPGVGAFAYCMQNLLASGLIESLSENVLNKSKPLLGICVGMQMLLETSSEGGFNKGLGWIGGSVEKIKEHPIEKDFKIPHVGWNGVTFNEDSNFFNRELEYDFYFDHSYAAENIGFDDLAGKTEYGVSFASVIKKKNILASQFHPEKSQTNGINFLKMFLESY